jgi:hypothetical protein
MWVPALADSHSGEVGHPNFQHPRRLKDRSYNGDVDRFPHLVIAAGLRAALVGGKAVWDRFDNGDNLLFKEADLRDPARAQVFKPLRETPWLDHVLLAEGGPKLTREQERRACELLGVAARAPVPAAGAAPAGVAQQFNVFEFLDDDEDRAAPPAAGSGAIAVRRPRRTPRKRLAPLLVAAAIAAILVGAGASLAVGRGGKEKEGSPKVVRGKDGDPPKPDRGSAPKKDPAEVKVPVKEKDPVPPPPTRADETPPAATPDPSRPEYVTAARRRANLLVDGSFEREPAKHWEPQSWRRNDDAAAFVTDVARSGKASAKLRSTEFDDCMVGQTVAVKPGTQYLLSGWVRTKNVSVEDGGRVAASLSVAGGFEASPSIAVADDWAYASLVFDTGERKEVRVGARLGHHGSCAKGTAWFDDIVLIELGTPAE